MTDASQRDVRYTVVCATGLRRQARRLVVRTIRDPPRRLLRPQRLPNSQFSWGPRHWGGRGGLPLELGTNAARNAQSLSLPIEHVVDELDIYVEEDAAAAGASWTAAMKR